MLIRNITSAQLNAALARVNGMEAFEGNLCWNRGPDDMGRTRQGGHKYALTLRVHSSKGPGARRSSTGRRMINACWHATGHFFDALPAEAEIVLGNGDTVKPGDAWQDRNIGSMVDPMYASHACECDKVS